MYKTIAVGTVLAVIALYPASQHTPKVANLSLGLWRRLFASNKLGFPITHSDIPVSDTYPWPLEEFRTPTQHTTTVTERITVTTTELFPVVTSTIADNHQAIKGQVRVVPVTGTLTMLSECTFSSFALVLDAAVDPESGEDMLEL